MFQFLFVRDLGQFHRQGLLLRLCWLLFARIEVVIVYGALAAFFLYSTSPQATIMVGFGALTFAYFFFVYFTVHFLTPLFFGRFGFGRLTQKSKSLRHRYNIDDFILIPSGENLRAVIIGTLPASGTIGQTYPLLQHPADSSIALPIIDDDSRFLAYIMRFAPDQRRSEISAEIKKLRRSGG